MQAINSVKKMKSDSIPIDVFWNTGNEKESKMHRIHAYPAKFPAFITTKALEFAENEGISVNWMADIFCGCGTVAYEAKRNRIDFWGCDVNPVATMIARTKSRKYNPKKLKTYHESIIKEYKRLAKARFSYKDANDRLKYWYESSNSRPPDH